MCHFHDKMSLHQDDVVIMTIHGHANVKTGRY